MESKTHELGRVTDVVQVRRRNEKRAIIRLYGGLDPLCAQRDAAAVIPAAVKRREASPRFFSRPGNDVRAAHVPLPDVRPVVMLEEVLDPLTHRGMHRVAIDVGRCDPSHLA
jgi:hypothetical protein